MALRGLALAFLLVLAPRLPAGIQKDPGPRNQGEAKEAGKGALCLSLTGNILLLLSPHVCYAALPASAHSVCAGEG